MHDLFKQADTNHSGGIEINLFPKLWTIFKGYERRTGSRTVATVAATVEEETVLERGTNAEERTTDIDNDGDADVAKHSDRVKITFADLKMPTKKKTKTSGCC